MFSGIYFLYAVLLLGFAPSPLQMRSATPGGGGGAGGAEEGRTSFHSSSYSRCSEMRAGLGAAPADGGSAWQRLTATGMPCSRQASNSCNTDVGKYD